MGRPSTCTQPREIRAKAAPHPRHFTSLCSQSEHQPSHKDNLSCFPQLSSKDKKKCSIIVASGPLGAVIWLHAHNYRHMHMYMYISLVLEHMCFCGEWWETTRANHDYTHTLTHAHTHTHTHTHMAEYVWGLNDEWGAQGETLCGLFYLCAGMLSYWQAGWTRPGRAGVTCRLVGAHAAWSPRTSALHHKTIAR